MTHTTNVADLIAAEIARRQAEIAALNQALAVLRGGGATAPPLPASVADKPRPPSRPKQRALVPGAARAPVPAQAGDGAVEVNGVSMQLSGQELTVFAALDAMGEGLCLSVAALEDICGSRNKLHNAVFRLKGKLEAAGATIGFVKGEGYRLENIA